MCMVVERHAAHFPLLSDCDEGTRSGHQVIFRFVVILIVIYRLLLLLLMVLFEGLFVLNLLVTVQISLRILVVGRNGSGQIHSVWVLLRTMVNSRRSDNYQGIRVLIFLLFMGLVRLKELLIVQILCEDHSCVFVIGIILRGL